MKIIGPSVNDWDNIVVRRKKRIAIDVFKNIQNIHGNIPNVSFQRVNHRINTRGNNSMVIIPRVKTEAAKKSFSFQGSKIFNELSNELRVEQSLVAFKNKLRNFKFL